MAELRNVIVFAVADKRYGFEIRWVREVVTLGFVTLVPTAPAMLCGVCNLHGHIVPVITPGPGPVLARQGDGAMLVEVGGSLLAVRLDKIDRVASYPLVDGNLVDGSAEGITLIEPDALRQQLEQAIARAASEAS